MELTELEGILREYNKKMDDNTRVNREILKRILISKTEKRINMVKIKAYLRLLSPLIVGFVLAIVDLRLRLDPAFYVGLGLFVAVCSLTYFWDVRYFILLHAVNFSETILSIKIKTAKTQRYKVKITKMRYMLVPVGICGIFLMFFQNATLTTESIVMLVLIVLIFIASTYYAFNYSTIDQFRALSKEIDELEALEK